MSKEEKSNINNEIYSQIQDVEGEVKDLDTVSGMLMEEIVKLTGVAVDIDEDNPPLNWDSHINPELNDFYNQVALYINKLDDKRELVNKAFRKIEQLEKDREKLSE